MPKFYIVNGIGPGFDGVLIEGDPVITDSSSNVEDMIAVLRFIDKDSILGDRNSSTPVSAGSMFIDMSYLEEVADPGLREFDSKNPYGKFQLDGKMSCGNIEVVYAQYEKALTVTVMEVIDTRDAEIVLGSEHRNTLYSETFTEVGAFLNIKLDIEQYLKDEETAHDLVFRLQKIKGGQSNG